MKTFTFRAECYLWIISKFQTHDIKSPFQKIKQNLDI